MNPSVPTSVDRTAFAVVTLNEADNEAAYWRGKTPAERLYAVEKIRQALYGYDPSTSRLQRVFETAELETS
jgi:hypothetical protein